MKKSYLKFGILILCVVLALCIVACSERQQEEQGEVIGPEITDNLRDPIEIKGKGAKEKAFEYIVNSMKYLDTEEHVKINPYWLCINTVLDFRFRNYEKLFDGTYSTTPKTFVDYKLSILADIALTNDEQATQAGKVPNANSRMLIELQDVNKSFTVFGLYYYGSTTYLDLAGKKYYFEQLNISSLAIAIVRALKLGTADETDFVSLVGNFLRAKLPDIKLANGFNVSAAIPTIWDTNIFENTYRVDYSTETVEYDVLEEGVTVKKVEPKYEYVREYFKANTFLDMLCKSNGVLDIMPNVIPAFSITWTSFGLPDMDQFLEDTIGFSLRTIYAKDWPKMKFPFYAINEMKEVKDQDGSISHAYVFSGFGIDIVADTGEYDVQFRTVPFRFGLSEKDDVGINMASYNFGNGKGSTYSKGNIANLEANFKLAVDSPEGDTLRVKDILGDIVSLGGLEEAPVVIDEATSYTFDVKAAFSIDLFDNANNYVQLTYRYNGKEVFSR